MEILIEEDKRFQQGQVDFSDLMTEKQKDRGSYYSMQYLLRRGEVDEKYKNDWDYLQSLYECKRNPDQDPDFPNSFIPLITPCVEGQVASMMESNMEFKHVTNNPGHQKYMQTLDAGSKYYRRKNRFKDHFKDFARYYDLLGNCWVNISWEKGYSNKKGSPKGCPKISVPPVLSVLVDGSIKDSKDLQYARYIIFERGYQPITWARKEFGDKYADALLAGYNRQQGENPDESIDDMSTFMLLEVWTRDNAEGNLQLIRMDANGLVFEESDSSEPYYENVDNEYPFGIARMIPQLGCFYGMGDGTLLRPMQETVNKLVDELEIAARFSAQTRTYADPSCRILDNEVTSDPGKIIIAKSPRENILTVPGTGVNAVIYNMIEFLLREAQKATRFHESMTGNQQGASATATQINSQLSQGSVGIKDKKSDISSVMAWADMYALNLCIENWKTPFWATISDGVSDWIDMTSLSSVNATVPMSTKKSAEIAESLAGADVSMNDIPNYEEARDEDGELIPSTVNFTTEVIIGESIPKGSTDMYNIWLGLSQMQVIGADGQPEPFVTPDRLRQAFEELLGVKLKTDAEEYQAKMPSTQMNGEMLNQMNPIGGNGTVQVPTATPSNLQQTVPQMPSGDSRSVQI